MLKTASLLFPIVLLVSLFAVEGSPGQATPRLKCGGDYHTVDPTGYSENAKICTDPSQSGSFVVRYALNCTSCKASQRAEDCKYVTPSFDVWYSCKNGQATESSPASIAQLEESAKSTAYYIFSRSLKVYGGKIPLVTVPKTDAQKAKDTAASNPKVNADKTGKTTSDDPARQEGKSESTKGKKQASDRANRYGDRNPGKTYSSDPRSTGVVVQGFENSKSLKGIVYYSVGSAEKVDQCIDIPSLQRCLPIHAKAGLQLPQKLETAASQLSGLGLVRIQTHGVGGTAAGGLIAAEGEMAAAQILVARFVGSELEVGDDVDSKGYVSCSKNKAGTTVYFSVEGVETTEKGRRFGKTYIYGFRCQLSSRYPIHIKNLLLQPVKESSEQFL